MGRPRHRGGWLALGALVLLGMLVVAVWGDDLRPAVHAFLQGVARRL